MQNRRGLIFLGLALVMGITAAWFTERMVSTPIEEEVSAQTTPVVVVRTDVSVATTLNPQQLRTIDWPADLVPAGALVSTGQAAGRVVRRPLAGGEPVLEASLFETGASGGLLAVIEADHRAVTVKVDNVIGVAGFVQPGLMVDVLATIIRVDLPKSIPNAKVILQNVRVLAVDQKLEEVRSGEPEVVSIVTLEVDPPQAERLIYAAHEGRLQLAMRSPGDDEEVLTRAVGPADVVGARGITRPTGQRRRGPSVEILNGTQLETRSF